MDNIDAKEYIAFAKRLLEDIENRKEYNPTDPRGEMDAAKKLIVRSAVMTQIADKEMSLAEAEKPCPHKNMVNKSGHHYCPDCGAYQ